MKKCPHCGHKLGFVAFMTRYGSDTLIAHSSAAHPREHLCDHCRQKLWLHTSPLYFKRLMRDYLIAEAAFAGIITILGYNAGYRLDPRQTAGLILTLLFLSTPFAVIHARYRSLVIHEEKNSLRADTFQAVASSK